MIPMPDDPVLAQVARYLEEYRWAAWLLDPDLTVTWISSEFQNLASESLEPLLGLHHIEAATSDAMGSFLSQRSVLRAGLDLLPLYIRHTPGGRAAVAAMIDRVVGPGGGTVLDTADDSEYEPVFGSSVMLQLTPGLEPVPANVIFTQLRDTEGALHGFMSMFVGTLPFRFIPLLARGDEATLERTVRLATPGHRQAAILFADLQASGVLSNRLPSALYFRLVRDLTGALDRVVTEHAGLVGRHAGDGVTAFFIADDAGSPSQAARAALEAAKAIAGEVARLGARYEEETDRVIDAKELLVNMGLHWGNALYMGQLVSRGRLEVTALGDPVNECARIQESATDGQMLASKPLIENLAEEDAAAVGLRPYSLTYQRLAEMPGATKKAVRDAGGIAVTDIA